MENTQLQTFITRLVNLHNEKKQISEMISEVKQEAKNTGIDADGLVEVVKRVLMNDEKVKRAKEREEIARLYAESIGQGNLFSSVNE